MNRLSRTDKARATIFSKCITCRCKLSSTCDSTSNRLCVYTYLDTNTQNSICISCEFARGIACFNFTHQSTPKVECIRLCAHFVIVQCTQISVQYPIVRECCYIITTSACSCRCTLNLFRVCLVSLAIECMYVPWTLPLEPSVVVFVHVYMCMCVVCVYVHVLTALNCICSTGWSEGTGISFEVWWSNFFRETDSWGVWYRHKGEGEWVWQCILQ